MTEPIRSDHVKPEKIRWLWRNRIPRGMLTVVAGRPDQGKGLFATHVAAEVSCKGTKVLYSAAEDSYGLMTRPRLEAAGAKLENVFLTRFQLPAQMAMLEKVVKEKRIGLIVIDPLASHLGSGVSRHSDNIRTVLGPLTKLIESTGTAVLIIEHALKRVPATGHPLNAIGGSGSGLPAAARMAFLFGADPVDEERRVLAPVKCNIAEWPLTMAFTSDTVEIENIGEIPSLVFEEELFGFDAMSLVSKPKGHTTQGRPPDRRSAAAEWLTNYLATAGGPVLSAKIYEDAKQYQMANKTLRRAAEDMKIVRKGGGKTMTWDLPEHVKELLGLKAPASETPAPAVGQPDGDTGGDGWDTALEDLLGGADE